MSTTLSRIGLNDRVYDDLRQRVLRRQPGPGARISLHELASELGVSRSPVHHALTRLVQEGLLSVRPRRGYYVTPVTADVIEDGFDVRLALELLAAEKSVGRLGPDRVASLRRLLADSIDALSGEGWHAANMAFHEFLVDSAGNDELSRLYRSLLVNRIMLIVRGDSVDDAGSLAAEHTAIAAAHESGDLEAARAAILTHVEHGRRVAHESLDAAGGVI